MNSKSRLTKGKFLLPWIWLPYSKCHQITIVSFYSKQLYALSVHPSKNCIAMQVGENQLNLLFLKEKQAEEVKLTFPKAKKILGFSFVFGDDFNFFVATNTSIDLYDISLSK